MGLDAVVGFEEEFARFGEEVAVIDVEGAGADDVAVDVLIARAKPKTFPKPSGDMWKVEVWQQPFEACQLPSTAPQHQVWVKEPLFKGQGYRLLKLYIAAIVVLAPVMKFWKAGGNTRSTHRST